MLFEYRDIRDNNFIVSQFETKYCEKTLVANDRALTTYLTSLTFYENQQFCEESTEYTEFYPILLVERSRRELLTWPEEAHG